MAGIQFGPFTDPEVVNTNGLWADWPGFVWAWLRGTSGAGEIHGRRAGATSVARERTVPPTQRLLSI